jgi:uncharacterized protein YybS (DUF2232 family)
MNDFSSDVKPLYSMASEGGNQYPKTATDPLATESNWVDDEVDDRPKSQPQPPVSNAVKQKSISHRSTLAMVETAFLASTASLIWLINYYFPLGPVLKVFFPIPIALAYLRWGSRASWMAALVSGLLLSVLMGPTRSIVFLMPYGLMGVQLGICWRRKANWLFSIVLGTLIGTFGFFFRFWLFSILLGEDLWAYVINQITDLAEWIFIQLGLVAQPSFWLIQILAFLMIVINNLVYLFAVHLVALFVLERLGNPISRPPHWVQVLLDYEQ